MAALMGAVPVTGSVATWPTLRTRWCVVILVAVYVPLVLTYSLLTRAYEDDDEGAHVQNVEYIVDHNALPRISVANGLESHQPPLYYLIEAGWQDTLGFAAFTPHHTPAPGSTLLGDTLLYSTDYTPAEHAAAVHVHELRILSGVFGLATVLLTFAAVRIIGMTELFALSAGLFVALYPKNLVAASSVSNDALVIPLCALALVLFLLSERARLEGALTKRRWHVAAMGVVLGAAALTKLTSLTIAAVLIVLAVIPVFTARRHQLRMTADVGLAAVGFLIVSGWWFLRNHHLYGQFLATNASESYLRIFLLHPVPWNAHLVFSTFAGELETFGWYNQPNLFIPFDTNRILSFVAVPCLVAGAWVAVWRRQWVSRTLGVLSGFALPLCAIGGFAAMLIVVKDTGQGDVRDALVGLSAIAVIITAGTSWLLGRINSRLEIIGVAMWPLVLLGVDLYVLARFLIPLGGL